MKPLELPPPNDVPLAKSPLSLVVCQVRHDRNLAASDPKRALAVHAQVSDAYPRISEATNQTIGFVAGPGGAQVSQPAEQLKGWQFRSQDEAWTASVQPEWFSLETSAYTTWEDFRARIAALTKAVASEVGPAVEQRVGLRYVDEIKNPTVVDPRDWASWIDDALLGPILHASLGPALRSTQQVLELQAPENLGVILRHGSLALPSASQSLYLLDIDCFRQQGRPFEEDDVLGTLERLHTLALQVFQASITPKLYDYLADGSHT